ncbi:MAG: tRNA pseudouridine(38-40) synthase TruA [Chlamydiae bacterium]|nr:tRNA pseudouridine(38-40) synthase TruA [Chlamydiota bacterium]
MRNIKLIVSYKGTNFLGWQKTPYGPSIQQALEKSLQQILGQQIRLQAASRTDAGVHARGQVVNFFLENDKVCLQKLQKGLNGLLPKEISISSMTVAPDSFHPTLDNKGKEYHYFLCNEPYQIPFYKDVSWHFPQALDIEIMKQAAQQLEGKKNFAVFCNERLNFSRSTTCTIHSIDIIGLSEKRLCIKIRGDRFLYKMVRNMVGTLAYIGCGRLPTDCIEPILETEKREGAGVTAPAHGLFLNEVFF